MADGTPKVRVCAKCGQERPSKGKCPTCRKASNAAWWARNPKYLVAYYTANREKWRSPKQAAQAATWRAANQENIRVRNAAYRAANREKIRAYDAAYQAAHPERVRARVNTYRAAHPDRIAARRAADSEKLNELCGPPPRPQGGATECCLRRTCRFWYNQARCLNRALRPRSGHAQKAAPSRGGQFSPPAGARGLRSAMH